MKNINFESLKSFIKNFFLTKKVYNLLKKVKSAIDNKNKFSYHGLFYNRSDNAKILCIVLAGYKEFSYEAVFGRLKKYGLPNMDVCVVSSGLFSERLDNICKDNNWSYLSTVENNVSLVQNVVIKLHPNARFIFKLDEDIFITENFFKNMLDAYESAKTGDYNPGVLAPLLLVNGYGYLRILKKLNLETVFSQKFAEPKYAAGKETDIENNVEVAKFMWGEGGHIPGIDVLNRQFNQDKLSLSACPIRFSIGAILFERFLWEDMGYFSVNRHGKMMGKDEEQLCTYCCIKSKPIIVCDNIVVGHLSFGRQNEQMKQYYLNNQDLFLPPISLQ